MYSIKVSDSIGQQVSKVLKAHIEANGAAWLVNLGYGPSNDYAASVASLITSVTGRYTRFETVARYIRAEKSICRNLLAFQKATSASNV